MLTRSKCSPGCERLAGVRHQPHGEVFYRQFANRRKLGRYVGLMSARFAAGSGRERQGISKGWHPWAIDDGRTRMETGALFNPIVP